MPWQTRRAFNTKVKDSIAQAVRDSERRHSGEIRFVVEGGLDFSKVWQGMSARDRALEIFSETRVWDTEHNNGVLIYVLLADRNVEIIADRGINVLVAPHGWEEVCRVMEQAYAEGDFERGSLEGIRLVSEHLSRHFPPREGDINELPDAPVLK